MRAAAVEARLHTQTRRLANNKWDCKCTPLAENRCTRSTERWGRRGAESATAASRRGARLLTWRAAAVAMLAGRGPALPVPPIQADCAAVCAWQRGRGGSAKLERLAGGLQAGSAAATLLRQSSRPPLASGRWEQPAASMDSRLHKQGLAPLHSPLRLIGGPAACKRRHEAGPRRRRRQPPPPACPHTCGPPSCRCLAGRLALQQPPAACSSST